MPGLVPGIHVLPNWKRKDVDGRDKPGHDVERNYAALRLFRNSPMRSSALRMFSVELA
jgi:hypothetical protein